MIIIVEVKALFIIINSDEINSISQDVYYFIPIKEDYFYFYGEYML